MRRRQFLRDFFDPSHSLGSGEEDLARLARAPGFVQRAIKARATRQMKRQHFGQVLPIEDVEEIFGFVNSITRLACICRHSSLGREVRYCYGVSLGPGGAGADSIWHELGLDASFLAGPDGSGLEQISKEEALEAFAEHERDGLCHSVWTFVTPFIGGICNFDRADCLAMRATIGHDVKVMFRAEYVAQVNPDLCKGCRACMRACQFGAIGFSVAEKKAFVDPRACWGCGVCRRNCPQDAISLRPRQQVPAAAGLW